MEEKTGLESVHHVLYTVTSSHSIFPTFFGTFAMILDPRIADLLLRWEELRAQGQIISPEELCRDCPELLTQLVSGLSALQSTCDSLHGTPQDPAAVAMPLLGPAGVPVIGDYQVLG